jgi:hypothetical protein
LKLFTFWNWHVRQVCTCNVLVTLDIQCKEVNIGW